MVSVAQPLLAVWFCRLHGHSPLPLRLRKAHSEESLCHFSLMARPYWNPRLFVQEVFSEAQFIRDGVDVFGHEPVVDQLERQLSLPGLCVSLGIIEREAEKQCLWVDP